MPAGAQPQTTPAKTDHGSSYGQILKSSSIVGGAQGINYIIGLVRTKVVAVLLGPSGVGLVGLYMSIISLVQTVAQLGIDQSGVREIAEAAGTGDQLKVARTARTLRRVCWLTGVLGWVLTASLSWLLAQWTFGSTEHMWAVAALGSVVLLESMAGGQRALLQGVRRISDLARLQVSAALLSTIVALVVYGWLRARGIVPVIILTSLVQLGCSWFYARRISLAPVQIRWSDLWAESRQLVVLGSAFMYGALLAALAALVVRSLIVRDLGLDDAGIYQAAWALSGMFAGFILQAMGADFYPRLTSAAHDNERVNKLVNEQIEVGMLLALPGILIATALSAVLMYVLYSSKFVVAGDMLPWFLVGVFGQVVSWPLGLVQLAKGATSWIYLSRTLSLAIQLAAVFLLIRFGGLIGSAIAFPVHILLQGVVVFFIARRLSGFGFGRECSRFLFISSALIALAVLAKIFLPALWGAASGILAGIVALAFCLRMVSTRVFAGGSVLKALQSKFCLRA